MKKRILALGLVLCTALSLLSLPAAAVPAVTVEQIPPAGTAYAASQTVSIDGRPVTFQMYALRNASGFGTNYVKLRDLAYALNGTAAQFEVEYDGSIRVIPGRAYTPAGGEMTTPFTGDRIYTGGPLPLRVGSGDTVMTAIALLDANGLGYTYFKLRDLGTVLGFGVGWDDRSKMVTLDTGSGSGGSDAQSMSDQALTQLAGDLMDRAYGAGILIANAGFVETDDSDTIEVDGFSCSRVIGYTTVDQAEAAAKQYWYSIWSRRAPGVSDHELDMMRSQFVMKNGGLYYRGMGVGGGGGSPVLERMISRTADQAVFAARMDWGDPEMDFSFEFCLVLEDGAWRYLDQETAEDSSSAQDSPAAMARAMLGILDASCTDACLLDLDGDGVKELLAADGYTAKLHTWQDGRLTCKEVGELAGGYQSWALCQDAVTGELGIRYANSGGSYEDTRYHYPTRDTKLHYVHSDGEGSSFRYYYIDGREVTRAEYQSILRRNRELEVLIDGGHWYVMPEMRIKAVRSELTDLLAGRSGRDLSDQTLLAQAEVAANRMDDLYFTRAVGGFVRWDLTDSISAGAFIGDGFGDVRAYRAIDYQTIAQAEAGVRELWHRIFSRRYPAESEYLRSMLVEQDGAVYRIENYGLGDRGGYATIDRMVSRTADEAVFTGHWDNDSPFQISLVFEDGTWKYGCFQE